MEEAAQQKTPCQCLVLPTINLNLTSWQLESGESGKGIDFGVRKTRVNASCAVTTSYVTVGRSHDLALLLLSGKRE